MHFTLRLLALGLAPALLLAAPASAQTAGDRFVPFNEFHRSLTDASPAEYVGAAENGVATPEAFEEMRAHLIDMYDGVTVRHSFLLDDQYFDCIPVMQQPSVRKLGITRLPALPARLPLPGLDLDGGEQGSQLAPGETRDKFGNAMPCERGFIPMRRMTLRELGRYRNLRQYFQKGPNGAGQILPPGQRETISHKYAHAAQNVQNFGGISTLTVWKPRINTANTHIFSLAQHWYVAFPSGVTQSAEVGWQNDPTHYGSQNSVLFIFWTADGYHNLNCYNLECSAFVQTSNTVMIGGRFAHYSVKGGKQIYLTLGFQYLNVTGQGAVWGLIYAGNYVGYYPGGLYNLQGSPPGNNRMSQFAEEIDYGGETVGDTSWPPMGSGAFPGQGVKFVAIQQNIAYFKNFNNSALTNATLQAVQPSPRCYKLQLHNNSAGKLKTYFYFGGPGGTRC